MLAAMRRRLAEVGLQLHPEDPDRVLPGRQATPRFRAHVVYVPGLHVPAARCAGQERSMFVSFAPAISKDALKKIGQEVRSGACTAEPRNPSPSCAWWGSIPLCGLDAVLRCVLPLGAVSAPDAHQRLPDALGPEEISPFQGRREFQQAWQRVTTQYPRFFAHWVWTTAVPAVW